MPIPRGRKGEGDNNGLHFFVRELRQPGTQGLALEFLISLQRIEIPGAAGLRLHKGDRGRLKLLRTLSAEAAVWLVALTATPHISLQPPFQLDRTDQTASSCLLVKDAEALEHVIIHSS